MKNIVKNIGVRPLSGASEQKKRSLESVQEEEKSPERKTVQSSHEEGQHGPNEQNEKELQLTVDKPP